MIHIDLADLEERNLTALEQNETPETINLEFKGELNLDSNEEKREAAKDVSALANTVGGRILYGVTERELAKGGKVAGPLKPLSDGDLKDRLFDVLNTTIFPRPRFNMRAVPVTGGEILVVQVYPALQADLHMVTGFKELRFYRRGDKGTIPMLEPEIREAYVRIAASRMTLESSLEQMIAEELARVPLTHESVLVVPWFGHRGLVNQAEFGESLGQQLYRGNSVTSDWIELVGSLKVRSEGYRDNRPRGDLSRCEKYACIRRNGLIHLARRSNTVGRPDHKTSIYHAREALNTIVSALTIAQFVLDKAAYWGPVRIIHHVRLPNRGHLASPGQFSESFFEDEAKIDAGEFEHVVAELNLKEHSGGFELICRELLDQLFQTGGHVECPWFDESGKLLKPWQAHFEPRIKEANRTWFDA